MAGTGVSRYRAIQTINADGESNTEQREVYMNGQHYPAPARSAALSMAAQDLIKRWGPYTQDFGNVVPLLQPARSERFFIEMFTVALALLRPVYLSSGTSAEAMVAVLRRPNADPGGPTYRSFVTPLRKCNTQSIVDMIRIVEWVTNWVQHCMAAFIVLHLIGKCA